MKEGSKIFFKNFLTISSKISQLVIGKRKLPRSLKTEYSATRYVPCVIGEPYDKQGKVAQAYERFTKEVEELEKRTKDRLRNDGVR